MKVILYPIMVLAACGLAFSIVAHGMALAGVPIPGGKLVLNLHIGLIVVWIPTVLMSTQMTRHASQKDFLKVAIAGCPVWMRRAFYALFGYSLLNFVVFMVTDARQPKQGRTDDPSSADIRVFSGHWMIFYGAAFAILYSRIHAPQLYRERRCPQGHTIPPTARFCSACGHDFSAESKVA